MSVYVDRWYTPFRGRLMCHMLADSLEELHAMAHQIGMPREAFQGHKTPHYDIDQKRRALALEAGAIEIDRKRTVELIRQWRARQAAGEAWL